MEEGDVRAFVEFIYSDTVKLPLSMSWKERWAAAVKIKKFTPEKDQFRAETRAHFFKNSDAEYYWSLVVMFQNVCESLRDPEDKKELSDGKENTSYKAKIANGIDLGDVRKRIKDLKAELFKGSEEAEYDFSEGKISSEFGTLADSLAKNRQA